MKNYVLEIDCKTCKYLHGCLIRVGRTNSCIRPLTRENAIELRLMGYTMQVKRLDRMDGSLHIAKPKILIKRRKARSCPRGKVL